MVAHDAEQTVRRAVESLQNQSLGNFELVVVDAGSRDGTGRLLDSLAERDMRLRVAHVGECGRPEALNLALGRALGRYALVFDADGWAGPNQLGEMVKAAEDSSLELVVGGLALSVSVGAGRLTKLEMAVTEPHVFVAQHDFRAAAWRLFGTGQLLPASAKLFSLDRVRQLGARFDDDSPTDHSFVIDYLRDVERVGVLAGASYHVTRLFAQAMRGRAGEEGYRRLEDEHSELVDLYRHWGLDGDVSSVEMLQSRYLEQLAGCVEGICGWGSSVPAAEQRREVARMIGTERAQLAASVARPRGNSARAMLAPIRSGNVALACAQARLISLLRRGGVAEVVPDAYL